ncbi:MAG: hypothetical protein R3B47_14130 [Bacteroidia bacterium]
MEICCRAARFNQTRSVHVGCMRRFRCRPPTLPTGWPKEQAGQQGEALLQQARPDHWVLRTCVRSGQSCGTITVTAKLAELLSHFDCLLLPPADSAVSPNYQEE